MVMGLCLLCGCGDIYYLNDYDDGGRLERVTAETKGKVYSLEEAYEIGYLSQTDLKKISYFHNVDNKATFPVELFAPVEAAIKNTYAVEWNADERNTMTATADDFSVKRFYGYYYKCCVVSIDSTMWAYPGVIPNDWKEIGGVKFHFTDYYSLIVWIAEENFYSLEDAYHYGWLTKKDMKSIAYYHNGGREGNEKVMGKNYTPMPKTPEVLDDETTLAIKKAYCDWYNSKGNWDSTTVEKVWFAYYGWYHDCAVIRIGYDGMGVTTVVWEEKIGGVTVHYTDGLGLSVWRKK